MRDVPRPLFQLLQESILSEAMPEPCVPSGHINCDMEDVEDVEDGEDVRETSVVELLRFRHPRQIRKQIGKRCLVREAFRGLEKWSKIP